MYILLIDCLHLLVPISFIYVQLPSQPAPETLWPMVEWKDVTSDYAGLFFRAEGGGSAAFGSIQYENSPRLIEVKQTSDTVGNYNVTVPKGYWSRKIWTGDHAKSRNSWLFL
jgi:hypothetical protein